MAAAEDFQFDRLGRHKKVYRSRPNPLMLWREEQFIKKYRLSSARVTALAADFGPRFSRTKGTRVGGGLIYNEQMSLGLRYLATGANFSVIAETQHVTDATVSRCTEDVVNYFYANSNRFIRWPHTADEQMRIVRGFSIHHDEKPAIMGCVDGSHIAIISPRLDREAVFVNRKGYHSLNAMVVCDSENYITHIDPCWAGSVSDSYAFNSSTLCRQAAQNNGTGWGEYALLGDSGYGLHPFLYTPYFVPTTPAQRRYNIWHRKTRSVVERTIGIMKQRWRSLDASGGYLHHTPDKAVRIVTACCCLHNIAVADRTPHLDHADNGYDRFVANQQAPLQPRDFNPDPPPVPNNETRRDTYARLCF